VTKEAKTAANAGPFFTDCEHWGKGGSYTLDPATGLRTPNTGDSQGTESAPDKAVNKAKDK
jgi:hypothetical protein